MMFTKIGFCAATLSTVLILRASAEKSNLFGAGTNRCAQFEETYNENPEVTEVIYYSWAAGFMSGMNAAAHAVGFKPKNLSAYSVLQQKQIIRQWCTDHPAAKYIDAVTDLLKSFPSVSDN